MAKEIIREIEHCLIIVLLVLSFLGYIEAKYPWMPEHVSREWTETVFWEGGVE